jgi:flagellar basal-body rod protein FlgC
MSGIGSVFSTALSGLQAATRRIAAAANNVANLNDVTSLSPKPGDPAQFRPLLTVQTSLAAGGTAARFQNVTPASVPSFQPDSPFANADGLVAVPNVDLATQMIDSLTASTSYKANAKVIEVAQQMQDQLLKIKA